jgi:hypothetical protein
MDWWTRRYPPDVFPSVQKAMEELASSGKIFAPVRVHDEINSVGAGGLKQWASANKNIFVSHDTVLQAEANKIQFDYPDLIDTTSPYDEADRWIIALAKKKGLQSLLTKPQFVKRKILLVNCIFQMFVMR